MLCLYTLFGFLSPICHLASLPRSNHCFVPHNHATTYFCGTQEGGIAPCSCKRIQVQENTCDHGNQRENNPAFTGPSSQHRRCHTKEGSRRSTSDSQRVWHLGRWWFCPLHVSFLNYLVVSWRVYRTKARFDINRTTGATSWDLWDPSIYNYNTASIETTGFLTQAGKIPKCRHCNGLMIDLIQQVTCPAIERDEDDRAQYQLIIGSHYETEQLVFVDESAFDRRVTRRPYAWAPIGCWARRRDFFIRGKRYYLHDIGIQVFISKSYRYSLLPALSLDGIIAVEVLDRPFTAVSFNKFIEGLLDQMNPWPQRNSVIIMDNASIHKSEELELMIENRYVIDSLCWLVRREKILTRVGRYQRHASCLSPGILTGPQSNRRGFLFHQGMDTKKSRLCRGGAERRAVLWSIQDALGCNF